jgi:hypothetical protein
LILNVHSYFNIQQLDQIENKTQKNANKKLLPKLKLQKYFEWNQFRLESAQKWGEGQSLKVRINSNTLLEGQINIT